MNRRIKYLVICLVLIVLKEHSYAQKPLFNPELRADTNYIVSYADIFTPRFVIIGKSSEFTLRNTDANDTDDRVDQLTFSPNDPLNLGFGFTYKWLGLNFAFNFPFINNDNDKYGKTKRFDLSTHFYGRRLIFDLGFQWYKGYYLANPLGVVPGWQDGDPYPSRGDISTTSFGGAGYYVFKHNKFSYRSAFTFNERQKKSAGSPVLGAGFSYYFVRADSSLVNSDYHVKLDSLNLEKANLGNIYAIGGYAQNFVVKYFFLSLTLGLGFGLGTDKLVFEDQGKVRNTGLSLDFIFRASVGYNNDKFYVGLSMYNKGFSLSPSKNIALSYSYTSFNIYAGYRFYNLFKKKEPLPWLWDLKI